MRLFHIGIVIGVAVLIFITSQVVLQVYLENDLWKILLPPARHDYGNLFKEVTQTVVVWWAPIGDIIITSRLHKCGQHTCYFTNDRNFRHHPQIKAMMFYGSNTNVTDLPLPRNGASLLWALLHEESPRNNGPLAHEPVLSLFNLTATFSRYSNYPLTTQYLSRLQVLTDLKYFVTTEEKNRLQKHENLALIMYIQSDCSTPTDRDSYVVELARHISIDSYGECLHNKDLPLHLRPPNSLDTMMSEDLIHLVAKYKFVLALENGVCNDYITEKIWRPLIAGAVPIYIGSPTIHDWLPNNESAVLGLNFATPKELSEYIHILNNNDLQYNGYLAHKLEGKLTNTRLVDAVESREWDTQWSAEKRDFVEGFSCHVCEKAHDSSGQMIATADHYSCPMPVSILSNAPNSSNFWLDIWYHSRCAANTIRKFVDLGVDKIPIEEYEAVLRDTEHDKC